MSLFLSITILMFLFVIAIAVYNLHKSFIEYVVSLKKLIEGETSTTLSSVHANFDTLFRQNEANFGTLSEAIRDISKPKPIPRPQKYAKPKKKKRKASPQQKRLASERMKARWDIIRSVIAQEPTPAGVGQLVTTSPIPLDKAP